MAQPTSRPFLRALLMAPLLVGLAASPALAQAEQRAAAAAARGDLRAAHIEWRNAARDNPTSAATRAALARVSLELGDGETAEREARAALEHGWDRAEATALLMRAYLVTGRHDALLREFPEPAPTDAAGPFAPGQVAAGRAMALLARNERDAARRSIALARQLAPDAAEPELAAAALALAQGDRAEAEAAVDKALGHAPDSVEALARKGTLLFERRQPTEALARFDRALEITPGSAPILLRRAEALLQMGEVERAGRDVDAALAVVPGNPVGHYMRAMLQVQARDWANADATLQRLGPALGQFADGFLLLAATKQGLGQRAQAEDAARRHLARRPDDPRAARMLAGIELQTNRPRDATATLSRMAERGNADAASLDMLGRLHSSAGRRREALAAFEAAHQRSPEDAALLARVAAARMALGDVAGAVEAAQATLRLDSAAEATREGAREMLAFAALRTGDAAAVRRELDRLPPEARRTEGAGVLEGSAHLMEFDLAAARTSFDAVLAAHPNSIPARMGLARLARMEGRDADAERLLSEVLRLDPSNAAAHTQLMQAAAPGQPRAAEARAVLEAVQAANPAEPQPALVLARVLVRHGEGERAATLLTSGPLANRSEPALLVARGEAHAAAGNWAEAERASRMALAEMPQSVPVRQQLAAMMLRNGDARGAELLIEQGLRDQPANATLQQTLVALVREARGLDAALDVAARQAANPRAQPGAATLRGDLLLAAQRTEEAAQAYAEAHAARPSAELVRRMATAWRAAGKPDEAAAALRAWAEANPQDHAVAMMLSQLDIEAGRLEDAERRLEAIVAERTGDSMALNNLAWVLDERGTDRERARALAQRAYFLTPAPDIADTLGWMLARQGEPAQAVPLLRQAAEARATQPTAAYRLAYALNASGRDAEAQAVLEPALEASATFPEREEAQRLLHELRGRR